MADFIHIYSRAQAIADGVLVDVTPQAIGFKYPVAIAIGAWTRCVVVPEGAIGQDQEGRLWDIFMVLHAAIKGAPPGQDDRLTFSVLVSDGRKTEEVTLLAVCGPGDDPEPVITIMLPEEE